MYSWHRHLRTVLKYTFYSIKGKDANICTHTLTVNFHLHCPELTVVVVLWPLDIEKTLGETQTLQMQMDTRGQGVCSLEHAVLVAVIPVL